MRYTLVFLLFLIVNSVTAQPLDWAGDMTIFGSSSDESRPCLSSTGANVLHAFCQIEPDTLAMKRSSDDGVTWSAASKSPGPMTSSNLVSASDPSFTYLLWYGVDTSLKYLFRFSPSAENWNDAVEGVIAPERQTNVACMAVASDAVAQPVEPYLNLCWLERNSNGNLTTVFAQSRDRGTTFLPAVEINTASAPLEMTASTAIAVTWSGEEEVLHVVATVDRPGSMPEELRVFSSTDQGIQWSPGLVVESSGYPQREPALAAFGNTLFLAYSRRTDVTAERTIFFTYSPDGGQTFAPPAALTDTIADEFSPSIMIDPSGLEFHLFYLMAGVLSDSATLMVMSGNVATPWQVNPAFAINEPRSATRSGGMSIVSNTRGVAAAWTSPFQLGDTDVRFDASWRSASAASPPAEIPSEFKLLEAYPNPFNGITTIELSIGREQIVRISLTDVLGRSLGTVFGGNLSAGHHRIALDLAGYPSGTYWLQNESSAKPPLRIILLR